MESFAHKVRKLSDLIGAAEKFYYKFMIRMPFFGSDSNIILIKSNKQLSFQDLRSRLQTLIKLLQDSIQGRSGEIQLTTFQCCLVSSAWEEEEEELKQKVKQNDKILSICSTCVKDDSTASTSTSSQMISIQNKLEALRDTERGLVAHNCYVKMKKAQVNLSLITILVNVLHYIITTSEFIGLSVASLLLMK